MKAYLKCMIVFVLTTAPLTNKVAAQCANRALHFNGANLDFVEVSSGGLYGIQNTFTIEFWFNSSSTSSSTTCQKEYILSLAAGGLTTDLAFFDCNGDLYQETFNPAGCGVEVVLSNSIRNSWHHLAMSYDGVVLITFLDCIPVATSSCGFNLDDYEIYLGAQTQVPTAGSTYTGLIDEFRIWNVTKSSSQIEIEKHCLADSNDANLLHYLKFDQGHANDPIGHPSNDNTGINSVYDSSPLSNNGNLINFNLIGPTSNFICSSSPLIYPENYSISIQDYTRSMEVDQICNEEPVHFCILDTAGNAIPVDPNINLYWEYNVGSGWQDILLPSFSGYCFGVSPGEISIDCSQNTIGNEEWLIRLRQVKYAGQDSCVYYSEIDTLKICCDVDPVSIDVTSNFANNLFCEDDFINYSVSLNSTYPFLQFGAPGVTIDWTYCENSVTYPLPGSKNNASLAYNPGTPVPAGQVCFKATVTNCDSSKINNIQTCFNVDPMPVCDSIDAMQVVGPLNQINLNPLLYEICKGDAAKVLMTGPFSDCTPTWEYAFDPTFITSYFLGTTNSSVNTNIIPTSSWPTGATTIYYRVVCHPLSSPSGCDPCYSNVVGIHIKSVPDSVIILGADTICAGDSTIWKIVNPDSTLHYEWVCDGAVVSTDTMITRRISSCCFVRAQDSCTIVESAQKCLTICEPIARISCPLAPNTCPKVGDIIHLTACHSSSNCGGPLIYQWSWDSGTVTTISNCDIYHIPAPTGTNYTIIVTDAYGCSDTTSINITPCP